MQALSIPSVTINKRKIHTYISFVILMFGIIISVSMPLLVYREPGPDALTLWASYGRADYCDFWNPISPDRSPYDCTAYLLKPTGINIDNAWIYGMLSNLLLTTIPILFFKKIPISTLFALLLWGVVRSFFLDNLTKEIIVTLSITVIMLFAMSKQYKSGFFITSFIYGIMVRPYWLIFSFIWVGVSFMKDKINKKNLIPYLILLYLAVSIAVQIALGAPVSSIRASTNKLRTLGDEGSKSLIISWITSGDFLSQTIDTVMIFFRLTFPIELLFLSGPKQLLFVTLMLITSVLLFKLITRTHYLGTAISPKVKNLACIPFSFLLTQALFEPDFGSFARHFSMMTPILFCALGLHLNDSIQAKKRLTPVTNNKALTPNLAP